VSVAVALSGATAQAQSPADALAYELSRSLRVDHPGGGYLDWRPADYDFSGIWTGATDYEVVRHDQPGTVVSAWAGQFSVNPAELSYPVMVVPLFEELGVYAVQVSCAAQACADMWGTRFGWDLSESDPKAMADPQAWEGFSVSLPRVIFAVESCAEAERLAARMDQVLAAQGAFENKGVTRAACPVTPVS